MAQLTGSQPILILPKGTTRYVGKEAQRMNIIAGRILAETIRTLPRGYSSDK